MGNFIRALRQSATCTNEKKGNTMSQFISSAVTKIGQLFANVFPVANTVTTIISPSQNLHGIVVRTLTISVGNGAFDQVNMFADTVQPTAADDYSKRVIFRASTVGTSANTATFPGEFYLAPGMGLWAAHAGTTAGIVITYDLLPADLAA
jgi:hypothetical protein